MRKKNGDSYKKVFFFGNCKKSFVLTKKNFHRFLNCFHRMFRTRFFSWFAVIKLTQVFFKSCKDFPFFESLLNNFEDVTIFSGQNLHGTYEYITIACVGPFSYAYPFFTWENELIWKPRNHKTLESPCNGIDNYSLSKSDYSPY